MMGETYNSFGREEHLALIEFSNLARKFPRLSGYLAGKERGGQMVVALENAWSEIFHVKHSIAVNSATSGLLAAAFASDLKDGDRFLCPVMTMSATASAPCFTGARPTFIDVEAETFNLDPEYLGPTASTYRAVFVTNLFGHPARLAEIRHYCDNNAMIMVEDNAQSPFAMEEGRYAGTIGHIGVFSLNVHKPLQCGEGGVICTDDDELAERMRAFINHGEHNGGLDVGLNLRMPELCAVVALAQLQHGLELINQRIDHAEAIIDAIGFIPGVRPPITRAKCVHSYYTIPFLVDRSRSKFVERLTSDRVPVVERYARPLHLMPAFERTARKTGYPVAEEMYAKRLFYIENCAWTFTKSEIRKIGEAFKRAAEAVNL